MTTSHAGRFVWRELMTQNPDAATAFYTGLFGWTTKTVPMPTGDYTMFGHDGEDLSGVMQAPEGAPSHWLAYLTVDDVDAACATATELGGTVLQPAFSVPNVGRMAVLADPQGAVFSPFASETPGASDTERTPPEHTFCWTQLNTADAQAAADFYSALCGWTSSPMGPDTLVMSDGKAMRCTIMKNPQPDAPAHWLNYVAVADVAASTAKALELGASQLVPPTPIPGMGRFSVLADPTGAVISLWWQDPAAQPGA